jgi:hypothetical protein
VHALSRIEERSAAIFSVRNSTGVGAGETKRESERGSISAARVVISIKSN